MIGIANLTAELYKPTYIDVHRLFQHKWNYGSHNFWPHDLLKIGCNDAIGMHHRP